MKALAATALAVRTVLGLVVGILTLLLVLALGLWWWSGTEGSLDWTLRRLSTRLPLVAEGVSGSLRSGLRVQRLAWQDPQLTVEARDVHLEWDAPALVLRTLRLRELQAASVEIVDRRPATGEPLALPESLALPLRVDLEQVAVQRITWRNGLQVEAGPIAGAYSFNGLAHQLRLAQLRFADGRYSGEATLGALGTHPLEARLQGRVQAPVPGSEAPVTLQVQGRVAGPLQRLEAELRLQASGDAGGRSLPRGTVTAQIAPFAAQPVERAHARLQRLDLGALWPQAPRTALSGTADVSPAGEERWTIAADLDNGAPGAWDQDKLPARSVKARGEWHAGTARVGELLAQVGDGTLRGEGQWRSGRWSAKARLDKVDAALLHSDLAPVRLGGTAQASAQGDAVEFALDLEGSGRAAARPASSLAALQIQEIKARGRWAGRALSLPSLRLRASDAVLQGTLDADLEARSGTGQLALSAPGLQANARGTLSRTRGQGRIELEARDLAAAQAWLRKLPELPAVLQTAVVAGQGRATLAWQGGWEDPAVQAVATLPQLQWGAAGDAWQLRDAVLTAQGRLRDARLSARGEAQQGTRRIALSVEGSGGLRNGAWQAQLAQARIGLRDPALGAGDAEWALRLARALDLQWKNGRLETSAGEALLTPPAAVQPAGQTALLTWAPVRWGGGELRTSGRLAGLPLAWLALLGGPQLAGSALSGDMVFDAQWDASLGAGLRLEASLQRVRGDLTVLAETAEGGAQRVPAGVRQASLRLQGDGDRLRLALRWDSERAGQAQADLATRLAPGGPAGWHWPAQAPLDGQLRAELPRIGIWSLLAPPGWRLRGALSAAMGIGGTREQPRFSGRLDGQQLALRSVVDGIELRDGRLRARFDGDRLWVEEFLLHGAGEGTNGGTLTATGEGRWVEGRGPELTASARLTRLRASIRTDRQLTVSGELAARITPELAEVNGRIAADQARIAIPEELPPRLGEDVVVHDAPGAAMTTAQERKRRAPNEPGTARRALRVAVDLDLGNDFRVEGRGIDTRLAGTLRLSADALAEPRLAGTLRTVGGEYRAYNQRLRIEHGVLRFTGAPDNPSLDVLALRPRLEERVGVQVTGSAQAPVVRLYSEPDMPDAQKLALLVTGRVAPATGAEAALVQQAAMALLAARAGVPSGGGVAGRLGLEDLSVRRGTEGPIVALGKRFSERFYASYERSLSGTLGTLYIFFEVSRRLKLRAEAGSGGTSAVDVIFTTSW